MRNIDMDYWAESQTEKALWERRHKGVKPRQAIKNQRTKAEAERAPIIAFWMWAWGPSTYRRIKGEK